MGYEFSVGRTQAFACCTDPHPDLPFVQLLQKTHLFSKQTPSVVINTAWPPCRAELVSLS